MLTERQLLILQVIIDDFIRSAHPVGSRSLAKKGGITFSSATIRNDMADLEELGFIEKTHTSSGRVPSQKGYRFYVDHLLSPEKLGYHELLKIKSLFSDKIYELETFIQNSAKVLSDLTKYTAIVLGPQVSNNKLSQFQIVPLDEEKAIAIIVTNTGHVEHKIFSLPKEINRGDLEKTVRILNSRLVGVNISELHDKLINEVNAIFKKHLDNYETMIGLISSVLNISLNEKLYYGGKTNMLEQPEFQDIEYVRSLLQLIEEESDFPKILRKTPYGIDVKIGTENVLPEMKNCSLITATYNIGEDRYGTIAILGPKRMHYSRVISILNLLSKDLSVTLTNLYEN